jgi:CelD/BcsL family acetyltransferase involved in cellulose biosynthesis
VVEEQVLPRTQALTAAAPEIEVIRDIQRFNSIASDWDELVDEWGLDRLFLSHTWFRTWWESFGKGNQLHVVTVRARGRLVAAAPMMRTQAGIYGLKLDALQAIYNPHTPRYDFIVANQDPHLYAAIWTELMAENSCDLILLTQIAQPSRTIQSIQALAVDDGWLTGEWIAPVSPFIRLGGDYETFFSSLGAGCRFNLTKRYQRLRRIGPVDVEVITHRNQVDEAMLDGLRIEAAAWKGENGTAMISDAAVTEFYIRLAKGQADLGQLRLNFLRIGGKRIAFSYVLQKGQRLCAVKIGYDPEYHGYSPGNMLLNLVLKDACARGIEEYDLLGGDDDWKFEWTEQKREHRWLFLFRNRLRPRILRCLKFGLAPAFKGVWRRPFSRGYILPPLRG